MSTFDCSRAPNAPRRKVIVQINFTLDKLDIRHYGLGHHRVAMSGTRNASYLDTPTTAGPRIRAVSLLIDIKKKLDSEKRRLLSFGEIAVGRAP